MKLDRSGLCLNIPRTCLVSAVHTDIRISESPTALSRNLLNLVTSSRNSVCVCAIIAYLNTPAINYTGIVYGSTRNPVFDLLTELQTSLLSVGNPLSTYQIKLEAIDI